MQRDKKKYKKTVLNDVFNVHERKTISFHWQPLIFRLFLFIFAHFVCWLFLFFIKCSAIAWKTSVKFHTIVESVQINESKKWSERVRRCRKEKKKKHLCKFMIEIKFYVQVYAKYFIHESNDTYTNKQICIVHGVWCMVHHGVWSKTITIYDEVDMWILVQFTVIFR